MKGQKIFNEIAGKSILLHAPKKGRNDALLESRNECLLTRYYYYSNFSKKCFEDIMHILVKEFFLSPISISRIVQENVEKLRDIKASNLNIYGMRSKWPQFKW